MTDCRCLPSRYWFAVVAGILLVFMSGCSGFKVVRVPIPLPTFGMNQSKIAKKEPRVVPESPKNEEKYVAVGVASWYGRQFHGRPTANGETYSMYELTAAHPTLPFDTRIKVTNLENGNEVVLRVNDRGPFVNGRIIDVSQEAARKLGFEMKGIAQVKIEEEN